MRMFVLAAAAVAALASVPAEASHWHHHHFGPYIGFGYHVPYWHGPWWYGPAFGVGIHVERYPSRRARSIERTEQRALKLYVYPAAGQSEEQISEDRYQCHVWAADESGYDPTLGTGSRADADSYTRAFTACMEARNYVVR